jgi:uncharacterized protein (DUF2062 family)
MFRFPAEIGTIAPMPRRFLKRILPDHRRLRERRFMRPFAALLRHPEYWAVRRENVARAFAIGLFIAFRANIPVAFATIWISNPFTIVPIFFFAYWLGTVILGVPMSRFSFELSWDWASRELPFVWKPLFTGSFVLSASSALLGYFGVQWIWRRGILFRYHRRRRSAERRASANAEKLRP